jgi:GNAT superfamily N-acetyltransferase
MPPIAARIQPMLLADLPVQQSLVELAGWNQLPQDLLRLWRHQPGGCFVATVDDIPVATITTTSHGRDVAWIGMMLVHPDFRRRGIATALMQHAINWLTGQGVHCIKLDATHEGAAVYARLGFKPGYELTRYVRKGSEPAMHFQATRADWQVPALDQTAFGADRSVWLRRLAADSRIESTAEGYGMIRPGRVASYLGPVVATSPVAARELVSRLLMSVHGTIFWDLPDPNLPARELASSLGFTPARHLTRMWMGQHPRSDAPHLQYGLTDFATG